MGQRHASRPPLSVERGTAHRATHWIPPSETLLAHLHYFPKALLEMTRDFRAVFVALVTFNLILRYEPEKHSWEPR